MTAPANMWVAATVAAVIRLHHHEHYAATLKIAVDGQTACELSLLEQPTPQTRDACIVDLSAGARTIEVSGQFAFSRRPRREHGRGRQQWEIVDLAPVIGPLRDVSRPFGQRMRDFLRAKDTVERKYHEFAEYEAVAPQTAESAHDIETAEARLRFRLPPDHVSLLRDVGAMEIGRSSFVRPSRMDRAFQTMVNVWETPRSVMQGLSPTTTALLHASTILYTEVGDGIGALLYEPALADPDRPSACGAQPAFYWIHEGSVDRPRLLTRRDGRTCRSYAETMIWLLAQQALRPWEELGDTFALVDRSASAPAALFLSHDFFAGGFRFDLRPVWEDLE